MNLSMNMLGLGNAATPLGIEAVRRMERKSPGTASGIALTHQSVTVAVPEDKAYLVGSICEICYNGKVVIATVTDTGGFAKYGRALDLAPGVYKAFGANSYTDWGTRNVYYRFI